MLRNFNIRTDRVIEAKRPDIVLFDKNQEMFIIDGGTSGNFRVRNMKAKEISKYWDVALDISRM